MSSITEHIERATRTNTLNVPIMSPTKVTSGVTSFNFRILPYKYNEHQDPFIEVKIHSKLGADKKGFALCPDMFEPDTCPYCKTAKKFRSELKKEEWDAIKADFYVQRNMYAPGIVRGAVPQFHFLKMSGYQNFDKEVIGILTNKELKGLFNLPENVAYINLWDVKAGVDLVVNVNPKNDKQKNPSFTIDKALKQTPVATNKVEMDLVKTSLANMPNLLEEMKKAYGCKEKIIELYNKQFKQNQTTTASNTKAEPEQTTAVSTNESYTLDEINSLDTDQLNAGDSIESNTVTDDDYNALLNELGTN